MHRNVCITAVEGQTGSLIADLLVNNAGFSKKVDSVVGLSLHPNSPKCKELAKMGVKIVPHKPDKMRDMVSTLKGTGCDTVCLIPPAHQDKFDITVEVIEAAKKANVQNVCFISSVGCDLAERDKQPRLREFIDLEMLVLASKGDTSTSTGHSPCVIRAGFYAENLLLYAPQAQEDHLLPIPIGENHMFAPVALGDVALVAAHVLSGKGKHGFHDKHRGQLIVQTGPMLASGEELATAASSALGVDMKFENISEAEAKKVLNAQKEHHLDDSEKKYLLEYYSLVREGKTNYISTSAFHDITGVHPLEPLEFFKTYAESFLGKKRSGTDGASAETESSKKRKTEK